MTEILDKLIIIIKLLRPKYYNSLSRIIIVAGIALLSKPVWIDLLNLFLDEFKFQVIGEWDWAIGMCLIITALIYNTFHRLHDLKQERLQQPAFQNQPQTKPRNFVALCRLLRPVLKDNEQIFRNTGPNSGSDIEEELRTDLTLWDALKVNAILPNNNLIMNILRDNKSLIPDRYKNAFDSLILHIEAFSLHVQTPDYDYTANRFPLEINDIISKYSFVGEDDFNFVKKRNWIKKSLKKILVDDWIIFGSTVFGDESSYDLDLAFLIKYEWLITKGVQAKIQNLSFDYKLKFRQSLHLTIFTESEITNYHNFLNSNNFKVTK